MSRHGFARFWYVSLAASLLLVGQSLVGSAASAQTLGPSRFEIGSAHSVFLGHNLTLPILYDNDSTGFDLGGVYLVLRYDTAALTLVDVEAGPLVDACGWELFSDNADSAGIIQIIAVAEYLGGSSEPSCYFESADQDTFALLNFRATNDLSFDCGATPLEFYWQTCADNQHTDTTGLELYSSDVVVGPDGTWYFGGDSLPTSEGAPDSCATAPLGNNYRVIDYVTGIVDFHCNEFPTNRGDLNANQIANEIADWLVYNNYFFYGLSAFSLNLEYQIAASDVNADGLVLTLRDAGYLWRVIVGDTLPIPEPHALAAADTAVFIQDLSTKTVSLDFADSLVQIFMGFSGEIVPMAADSLIDVTWVHSGGGTSIMLTINLQYYSPQHAGISSGPLLTYSGNGEPGTVEVADWHDGIVPVSFEVTGEPVACGDADGDQLVDISDVVKLIQYIFAGGDAPIPLDAGDVNCDTLVNITDVVYLLNYIFDGGPSPCSACP